jgi:N-acyl-D-aspartate/D-glutamate deacylase
MVRKRKWLSLGEAVHKVTGKAAARFHMNDRGRIAEGYAADITVFDPEAVDTIASYELPDVTPTGIHSVWRNGKVVVDAGMTV